MATGNQFVSALIDTGAAALAAAAERLLAAHPDLNRRFAPDPFAGWREHLAHRLHQLAASIAMDAPGLFAADVAWSKAAFSVRAVPIDDLRHSLAALRETLADELPDDARPLVERHRAAGVITDAVDSGLPALDAYMRVLVPAEREIGRMWHAGELNVAEEHFATATTELVASLLYPRLPREDPRGATVISAAAPGNLHSLAVRLVADVFETEGWRAIHLGADVPIIDLAQAVEFFAADVLALSVTMTTQLKAAAALVRTVRTTDAGRRVKIIVGGQAFAGDTEIWRAMGADAFAHDPVEAVRIAESLVGA